MRLHISMADDLLAAVDQQVGPRERSAFIERAVRRALEEGARDESLESAFGAIADTGHEWDDDPAAWVRRQRADDRRVG